MGLLPREGRSATVLAVARSLAGLVPFLTYLGAASAHAYWLDAGELVEAAAALDIAHPPGHPLAALLGFAASLVPLGPLALRVALGQAACASVASVFFFSAIDTTVRALGVRHDRLAVPIALGAAWLVAGGHPLFAQAVRPEVYALQAMFVAIAVERIVALEASWPTRDLRPLGTASLALGLGLANHHFMAVLVLPALAPTFARVYRARGGGPLLGSLAAVVVGLSAYAYLPVRARAGVPVDLGDPQDAARLFWVVSAQAFQHADRFAQPELTDRAGEVAIAIVENVPVLVLVLAIAGAWALVRTAGARRLGWIWIALFFFACAGRAWMGNTSDNPDALGYLVPAFLGIAALAAALVAALASQLGGPGTPGPGVTLLALATLALGVGTLHASRSRSSLSGFHATDDLDELRVRSLPPRAVVVAFQPQTVFRHWELSATERARPDVTLVPIPFLGYPGMPERLIASDPSVRELVTSYRRSAELLLPVLQSLAARRPVLLEPDVRVPRGLDETLVPRAVYFEVVDAGTTPADVAEAGARRAEALSRLTAALEADAREPETIRQLLWIHYVDALYYAAVGALDRARESIGRARALAPSSREIRALAERLAEPGLDGPIDVLPFTVGASP